MFRIVVRILSCLSVVLAIAFATGNQSGAVTACPYASTIETAQAHVEMPVRAQDTAQSDADSHQGHSSMPKPCKYGCQIIVAIQPSVAVTQALQSRPLPIRAEKDHLPSRKTPPVERPPNPVA